MDNSLVYFYIYKPYGVLSQFTPEGNNPGLGSIFSFPEDVYPVGRLDVDSEGLLLLTNDTSLNHKLLNPKQEHWRTYWVQVEGEITEEALQQLCRGVSIRIQKKDYRTLPAEAGLIQEQEPLPERDPPIRFRKSIPTSWIYLRLQEGKNRQVRRMTAAVGFPTLRLVRVAIEDLALKDMEAGDVREVPGSLIYKLLKLEQKSNYRPDGTGRGRSTRNSDRRF
ncbi:pseudouridine synthase family protein [Flammeovirgaceae bacterium 311]|nr:pseudouridine synthase family protein [Flammeovirgaceae bacterium 311]